MAPQTGGEAKSAVGLSLAGIPPKMQTGACGDLRGCEACSCARARRGVCSPLLSLSLIRLHRAGG